MSDDEFLSLLGDDESLEPIKQDRRVSLNKNNLHDASQLIRRQAAVDEGESQDPLSDNAVPMIEPTDYLQFQRPGVQNGVFKNLRMGRYSIDAVLDMHRMSVEEARKALWRFIQDCVESDVRSALITHGKGEGREKPALLKSCVNHWLPQINEVLAFHTAQKQHGSYGATYVLIRKSDKKKSENQQLHEKH
ncbi:MAG: DNA-nicking Smr family endonuclease [Flavobacteriales bacterium]|jgi:DNA-nicking Smr family endonuclease